MTEPIVTVQVAPHSCEISRNASGGVSFTVKAYADSLEAAVAEAKAKFAGLDTDYPPARKP